MKLLRSAPAATCGGGGGGDNRKARAMTDAPITVWHCPRCGDELHSTGSIEMDGETMPVFQCDRCVVTAEVFGEPFEVALTFAVNAAGQPVDPADDTLL